MLARIRPEVFGVEPRDYNQYASGLKTLNVNGDSCNYLTWSNTEKLFKMNSRLFACDMQVEEISYDNEQ